jgi:hypothetical protein
MKYKGLMGFNQTGGTWFTDADMEFDNMAEAQKKTKSEARNFLNCNSEDTIYWRIVTFKSHRILKEGIIKRK